MPNIADPQQIIHSTTGLHSMATARLGESTSAEKGVDSEVKIQWLMNHDEDMSFFIIFRFAVLLLLNFMNMHKPTRTRNNGSIGFRYPPLIKNSPPKCKPPQTNPTINGYHKILPENLTQGTANSQFFLMTTRLCSSQRTSCAGAEKAPPKWMFVRFLFKNV